MAKWLDFSGKPEKEGVPEITPDSLKADITSTKTDLEKKLADLGDQINNHPALKAMQTFIDTQNAAEAARQQQQQSQQQQQQQQQVDDQFKEVDATTQAYIQHTMKPFADNALYQQGSEMRRSIFEDQEAFPYYTGAIKAEIDAMLDKQPLATRANADAIRNTYAIICFNKQKEINENKHRSRMSSASSAGTGTGAPSGNADPTALPTLTQDMQLVAKKMGMTNEQYAQAMKELQSTGEYA
jgi:type II secretory pathway pseudopilin PulG